MHVGELELGQGPYRSSVGAGDGALRLVEHRFGFRDERVIEGESLSVLPAPGTEARARVHALAQRKREGALVGLAVLPLEGDLAEQLAVLALHRLALLEA